MARQAGRFPVKWKPLKYSRADYLDLSKIRLRHGPILRRGRRGARRPTVGVDPQEARAVPMSEVYGSLPERIVYKELVRRKIPFSFQSSMAGGRMILGGMVADFILIGLSTIIRVQSQFWHSSLEAIARDDMQRAIMEKMGYTVLDLWDYIILAEDLFDDWMRRLFEGRVA